MNVDWHAVLFNEGGFYQKMEAISLKYFKSEVLASEAVNFAIDIMRENNWHRLNTFESRNNASPFTFINVVFINLLNDFRDKKFGACKPPKWIRSQGGVWIKIFKLLCCQHQNTEEIFQRLLQTTVSHEDVLAYSSTIKAHYPSCGQEFREVAYDELDKGNDEQDNPEDMLFFARLESFKETLHIFLNNKSYSSNDIQPLYGELNGLNLSSESIVLLRLVYQEKLTLKNASDLLSLSYFKAYRLKKDAENKIYSAVSKFVDLSDT